MTSLTLGNGTRRGPVTAVMRILMTSNGGAGHIGPLVPFAHVFLRAGHEVLLAAPAGARELVEGAGLPFEELPDPPQEPRDAVFASLGGLSSEEQGVRVMRRVFAGIDATSSLPGVLNTIRTWRPDVVLREPTEYAALLAAERLGVRHGRVGIMAHATETWGAPVVAPVLDRHRRRLGLRPNPSAHGLLCSPYLTVFPEALEGPDDRGSAQTLRFREPRPTPRPLPDWWRGDERPLVYVTYGSVTPTMAHFPALFRATLAAVRDLPARVLFTVGNEVALETLGPAPPSVRVERWVAQADVMPHTAAMVGHGGSGTTRLALASGVPSVVVPGFADQMRNAERVAALGAGIALDTVDPMDRDPHATAQAIAGLGSAVRRLLDEPSYRATAGRVAEEVAALPAIHEAPATLEDWLEDARAA